MLNFEFNFRWGRYVYIGALAAIIGYFFAPWAGLICLLALVDVKLDDNVFHTEADEYEFVDEDVNTNDDVPYGPSRTVIVEENPTADWLSSDTEEDSSGISTHHMG